LTFAQRFLGSTRVTRNGVLVEDYGYDAQGRRISEFNSLRGISSRAAVYDDDDRLVTSGDYAYGFDADGFLNVRANMTTQETTTYAYTRSGQLNSVTLHQGLPEQTLIEYVYNAAGQRVAKKVNGAITEKYLWAGITGLLAVYDADNNLLMRFEGAKMVKNGQTYYLITDQVGSVRAVVDASGAIVKEITYDSFGNILTDTNPAFTIPLGFAGGLHDRDTGLVHFGFRDYDPDSGTWTAKDPVLFASGDIYLYEYCSSDPINGIDPTGENAAVIQLAERALDPAVCLIGLLTTAWYATTEGAQDAARGLVEGVTSTADYVEGIGRQVLEAARNAAKDVKNKIADTAKNIRDKMGQWKSRGSRGNRNPTPPRAPEDKGPLNPLDPTPWGDRNLRHPWDRINNSDEPPCPRA